MSTSIDARVVGTVDLTSLVHRDDFGVLPIHTGDIVEFHDGSTITFTVVDGAGACEGILNPFDNAEDTCINTLGASTACITLLPSHAYTPKILNYNLTQHRLRFRFLFYRYRQ